MDQNTIMDALQRALANGTGSLDDLDNLMSRVKEDIAKVRAEQEEAARKEAVEKAAKAAEYKQRGEYIAELATRLLDEQLTDDDVAFVIRTHLKQRGVDSDITGKDIAESLDASNELSNALSELGAAFSELMASFTEVKPKTAPAAKPAPKKEKTADDIINQFLQTHGLR